MRGHACITRSKAHGSGDLTLHVPLAFNASAVPPAGSDVVLNVTGAQPALVFEDEASNSAADADPSTLSLYKPDGQAELHLLGEQLLLSDGTDARAEPGATLSCGTGTSFAWSAPSRLATVELGLLEGGSPAYFVLESESDGERISLSFDSINGTLTVGGATRLARSSRLR